jgi:hypothetical protein
MKQLTELPPGFVRELAEYCSFSYEKVAALLTALKQAGSGLEEAEAVSRYLANTGLEGLGAFKVLLNIPDSRMTLTSSNGLVGKLKADVKRTLDLYEDFPLTEETTKEEISDRFDAIQNAEKKVATIKEMISRDPFLTDSCIKTALEELDKLVDQLRAAFENDAS